MFKRNIIILFLLLVLTSCIFNNNKNTNLTYSTGYSNQEEYSGNIINNLNSSSGVTELTGGITIENNKALSNSGAETIINEEQNKNENIVKEQKVVKKPDIKNTVKKDTNVVTNEKNVDDMEKELEKELDSLIDLINKSDE